MSTTLSDHYDELQRHVDNLFRLGYGPWLIPLRGKIPQLEAWPSLPPATDADVEEWLLCGYNLGLRTGSRSGIFVIDVDKGATWKLPSCLQPTVISPGGGIHCYVRAPNPCPPTTVSDIAPKIDTRGEGGQVTFPGSAHPHGGVYRWANGPLAVADLPPLPRDLLPPPKTVRKRELIPPGDTVYIPTSVPAPDGYIAKALHSEIHAVRTAPEGGRNDQLNRSAFNLGQLVAGGELDCAHVQDELEAAANHAGLGSREIEATIRSGLNSGMQQPRKRPERTATYTVPAPSGGKDILSPGAHEKPDGYVEVSNRDFAEAMLGAIPDDTIYMRAGELGEINSKEGRFYPIDDKRMRTVMDEHVKVRIWKKGKDEELKAFYRPSTRDMAHIVMGYARAGKVVRRLRFLATHPVYVEPGFTRGEQGWNSDSGTYLTEDIPDPLPLDEARDVIDDILVDFPFGSPADRENFVGLMLTPMLRPAIREPVPMHLIGSPVERTGKTKLAEIVLGCGLLGHPTPALQLGHEENEREKRIVSLLLSGASVIHLDNLDEFLDSPSLASLLTSSTFQGRVLGASSMVSVPNGMTIVGTGNNVHASGEIAKRIVPITLLPGEDPETRNDYQHPRLREYIEDRTELIRAALIGYVDHWIEEGCPLASISFGGFERWSQVIGGILGAAGHTEWLGNLSEWRASADEFGGELQDLVLAWLDRYGASVWVAASDLYMLAEEQDLFAARMGRARNERGRKTVFGMLLNRFAGRALWGHRIAVQGRGARRMVRLEAI